MKYIPHGNYKDKKWTNVITMMPGLFKGIDFRDFALTLGSFRANDCFDGITFLFSSKHQENDGAKIVMMLSAIERTGGEWKPLETVLAEKDFKAQIKKSKNGQEALKIIENTVENYLENFGSMRSIVNFFKSNLNEKEKRILTGGIRRSFTYKKQKGEDFTLFQPEYSQKQEDVDQELGRLLKSFIYNIRNEFAHNANYIILPNKKFLKDRKIFELDVYKGGEPKEHWVTILSFETLHKLFCSAFMKFWRKEYRNKKKALPSL